tara:strand:+ start:642 stop:857 length:216 start_codon:yes stop_codon:yes gene_type:complete
MTYNIYDMAKDYIEGLNKPANGWGQHIINGKESHFHYGDMIKRFGHDLTKLTIQEAVQNYKSDRLRGENNE